jgi:regulator of sigma E protease
MSIIIFILVLGLLIFIHELGHFLVAKKAGIRVDEFAIGFPPRLFSFKKGGTAYSLNLIPFGGYVKIFGESPEDGATEKSATDSIINKPKSTQALVLVAGIVFNVLLAFLIFIILFVKGAEFGSNIVPFVPDSSGVRVAYVLPDSVADKTGVQVGDTIVSIAVDGEETTDVNAQILDALYSSSKKTTVLNLTKENNESYQVTLVPVTPDTKFGLSLSDRVFVQTNIVQATQYAFLATGNMFKLTAQGLLQFLGQLVTGRANFKEVAGPIGIVGLVGQAAENGLNEVLFLTAIISINLAVLNLLPFPALDGGRLAVIGIEAVIRRDLDYKKVAIVNVVGFFLLITLMIVLTFHDIKNLFN